MMGSVGLWIWFHLCACRPPAEVVTEEVAPPVSGEPLFADEASLLLDTNAIAERIEAALTVVVEVDLRPFVAAYGALMGNEDDSCPVWQVNEAGQDYWLSNCSTTDGAAYEGWAMSVLSEDRVDESGNIWQGEAVYGDGSIAVGDTQLLLSGGVEVLDGVSTTGQLVFFHSSSAGSVLTDEAGRQETIDLGQWAVQSASVGAQSAMVGTTATVPLEDASDTIVALENLVYNPWRCGGEPSGTTQVRMDGQWVSLFWDGGADPLVDEDCDGCAEAWLDGSNMGQVCVDFSALDNVGPWAD